MQAEERDRGDLDTSLSGRLLTGLRPGELFVSGGGKRELALAQDMHREKMRLAHKCGLE